MGSSTSNNVLHTAHSVLVLSLLVLLEIWLGYPPQTSVPARARTTSLSQAAASTRPPFLNRKIKTHHVSTLQGSRQAPRGTCTAAKPQHPRAHVGRSFARIWNQSA